MTFHSTSSPSPRPHPAAGALLIMLAGVLAGCNTNKATTTARPTTFWPPSPNEPRIQFLRKFEKSSDVEPPKSGFDKLVLGNELQQILPISKPYGLRMWQGKIYICDLKQHAVVVLDLQKKVTRLMGVTGGLPLGQPSDIAIGPEGNKYVADPTRNGIVIFNAQDQQVGVFQRPEFSPVAVAVYKDELAVIDAKLQRVELLDRRTGAIRQAWGGPGMADGQFVMPVSVAYDTEGNVWVSDFMKGRMQKFDRQGKLLSAFGQLGKRPSNFARLKHIAIDRENLIYTVDASFFNVQLFDPRGQLLTFFGSGGGHPGAMFLPVGICVSDDPKDIELFKDAIHPAFDVHRLILVTNQMGTAKVAVYGLGQLKPGKTLADITPSRNAVPTGIESTTPTTLPTAIPDEPVDPVIPPSTRPASAPATRPAAK